MCGSEGVVKVRYKYPPLLLSDEIDNRVAIMQPFEESEIWYILYTLSFVAARLHDRDLVVGDVRPRNIFLF